MFGTIASVLGKATMSIVMALITEKVMVKLILVILKKLVASTSNTLDDELYKTVEDALSNNVK